MASLSLIPIAMVGFSSYVHFGLGMAWPWSTLGMGWSQHVGLPWEGILGNVRLLVQGGSPYFISLLFDLLIAILTIALLVWGWRKLPPSLVIFTSLIFLSAIVKVNQDSCLVSVSRYVLSGFPIFILLGLFIPRNKWQILWFSMALLGQATLTLSYYAWVWVA